MKRFLLFVFCACYAITYAQIVSPGTGITLTFNDLVYDPSGAVTSSQPGVYEVHQNLTLAANDTLLLDAATMEIYMDAELSIQVHGCVRCASRDDKLIVSGVTTDASSTLFELRFEDADVSILSNLLVEYCQQILVSNSPITFDNCEFRYFNSQVIKYMNCNPMIRNCYFHDNQSAAVNSGVNVMGSPIIRNNQFYHNVLSNVNQPQLNLGPGSVNDTIFIEDNTIVGCSSMSGGIVIANLMNVGNTKAVIRGNVIENNRYGYNQQGNNIYSIIEDNIFRDNNLETNPMNGGSGISIYGSDETCAAKLRRNIITGNLWGVTAIYYHSVDMGTAEDYGYNCIYDNGNGGEEYDLYNNANSNLAAIGNYWGEDTESYAESVIFHQPDQANLGLVSYSPVVTLASEQLPCYVPDSTQTAVSANHENLSLVLYPNPASSSCYISASEPILRLDVYNMLGQSLLCKNGEGKDQATLSLETLPKGIYLLEVRTMKGIVTKKLQVK